MQDSSRPIAYDIAFTAILAVGAFFLFNGRGPYTRAEVRDTLRLGLGFQQQQELTADQTEPTIGMRLYRDPTQGWNLVVDTPGFRFLNDAEAAPSPMEGYGYLYVDGRQVARMYTPWFHLPNLTDGEHVITVALQSPSYAMYTHEEEPIAASFIATLEGNTATLVPMDAAS
ncbi:MAG: hypothetical protein Q7R81_04390 [Candidatus Peregrinibacteria bacterium]|nr:hypothetical protein [Candidatus Peregrinibacteria bacterium]